jgi:2-polyprenyl-3-methyl-5-hydroxy-6-metoxy-1,4-benzoquinol methylase/spore coat polysaccharide biosynthesis predicted glycosyltransferase SpsG
MRLTAELRSFGREAFLFIPNGANLDDFLETAKFAGSFVISQNDLKSKSFCFIILDRYQTPQDELLHWKKIAPVIGIDEGGSFRDNFDFLVDILIPQRSDKPRANITSPSLLNFPPKTLPQKKEKNNKLKILVTFGHEDRAGLGLAVAKTLSAKNYSNMEITLLRGGLSNNEQLTISSASGTESKFNFQVLETIPNLSEHLDEYDLIFTHYGITAWEALYSGTPVLLINPTSYHEKISRAADFKTTKLKQINSYINDKSLEKLRNSCKNLAIRYKLDKETAGLAGLVNSFDPKVNRQCPVCGREADSRSIARFNDRTYRRCPHCQIIYMDRIYPAPIEYDKEYFFESYKKQYGKTYIEDFPNLKVMAKRRLEKIKSLLPDEKERTVLDIGCAYGAFLAAAKEESFEPFGIDPAQDAIDYVRQTLEIKAVNGFFPNCFEPNSSSFIPHSYSVVTLWYVIEHFTDCRAIFENIKKILKPGGILAFSTPSFSGISGTFSLKNFLEKSPEDHCTIWSPKMCKKALALFGFKVKKIVISGHHPERFPLFGKFAKSKKGAMYRLLMAISRLFGLGDTFEVYAESC